MKYALLIFFLVSLSLIGSATAVDWYVTDSWAVNLTAEDIYVNESGWFAKDSWVNYIECDQKNWTLSDSWAVNVVGNDTGTYWNLKDSWFNYIFATEPANKTYHVVDSWVNYIQTIVPKTWHLFDSWSDNLEALPVTETDNYLFISSYNNHTVSKYYANFTYINTSISQEGAILNMDMDEDYIYAVSTGKITKYYKDNLSIQNEIINVTMQGTDITIDDFNGDSLDTSIWYTVIGEPLVSAGVVNLSRGAEAYEIIQSRTNYTPPLVLTMWVYEYVGKTQFGFTNSTTGLYPRIVFYDAEHSVFEPYISLGDSNQASNWTLGAWHKYVVNWTSTSIRFYQDDVEVQGSPFTSGIPLSPYPIQLKIWYDGNISVDNVSILAQTVNTSLSNLRDLTVTDDYVYVISNTTTFQFNKDLELLKYYYLSSNLTDVEADDDLIYLADNLMVVVNVPTISLLYANNLTKYKDIAVTAPSNNRTIFDLDYDDDYIYSSYYDDEYYYLTKHYKNGTWTGLELMTAHELGIEGVQTNFGTTQLQIYGDYVFTSGVGINLIRKYDKNLELMAQSTGYGAFISSFDYNGRIYAIGKDLDIIKTFRADNLSYINQSQTLSISGYKLIATGYDEGWISIDGWTNNIFGYNYTVIDIWTNVIWSHGWVLKDYWTNTVENTFMSGTVVTDIINNIFIPFVIIFLPALILYQDWGKSGFIVGLSIGVILSVISLGLDLGLIILGLIGIGLLFIKIEVKRNETE